MAWTTQGARQGRLANSGFRKIRAIPPHAARQSCRSCVILFPCNGNLRRSGATIPSSRQSRASGRSERNAGALRGGAMTHEAAMPVMAACRPDLVRSTGYSPAGPHSRRDSRPEKRISRTVEERGISLRHPQNISRRGRQETRRRTRPENIRALPAAALSCGFLRKPRQLD